MPDAAPTVAGPPGGPGCAKDDPILVADGVRRAFGGLVAVDVDHVEIQRGVITSLIGPNGAGKTTFFNCLTRFDRPDAGTWSFDGVPIDRKLAYQIPRLGLVRTFQLTRALSRLSVLENVLLATPRNPGENVFAALVPAAWRRFEQRATERADILLGRFKLDHLRDEPAGTLSGGQRKLLELARALATEPKAVLLDEPMAGVNPALRQTLSEHIVELRDSGLTVLLIEHDMDVVMSISDWVVCMAEGRVIAEGTPTQISGDEAVIDAYLGAHHGEAATGDPAAEARVEGPGPEASDDPGTGR